MKFNMTKKEKSSAIEVALVNYYRKYIKKNTIDLDLSLQEISEILILIDYKLNPEHKYDFNNYILKEIERKLTGVYNIAIDEIRAKERNDDWEF